MIFKVVLSMAACCLAAPTADADAQLIAGHGLLGHGLLGHGLAYGAAPVAVAHAAPVAVAHAAPVAVAHAAPVAYAHAAPVAYAHAAPVAVATAPVVHQVITFTVFGYFVHLKDKSYQLAPL